MVLPQPPDDASRRLIEETYALFHERSVWPTFMELYRRMDRRHDLDAEEILGALPEGLIYGPSGPGAHVRDDDRIGLTIAAVAAVSQAEEDCDLFLQTVKLATRMAREGHRETPSTLSSADVVDQLIMPAAGRGALLSRLGNLFRAEGYIWSQLGGDGASWVMTLDHRRLRPLREVEDLEQYWNLTHSRGPLTPTPVQALEDSPAQPLPEPRSASFNSAPWSALLPKAIADVALPRLEAGYHDDAIFAAWKVIARQLQLLSGRTEDGAKLVNHALGTNGAVRLGDDTERGVDEQQGYFSLLRALAHLGRNMNAHRLVGIVSDEAETAALLLLAGMCVRRFDAYSAERSE